MLNALHDPDRAHAIGKAYVQNFDGRKWGSYADGWVDASEAVYVMGSRRMGAMGPTLVPFLARGNAEAFAKTNGGVVLAFKQITAEVMAEHARMARKHLREGGGAGGGMRTHGASGKGKSLGMPGHGGNARKQREAQ
jgi:nitrous oxide reductase accessory protein NosL